ncbi:MAG: extracellular solute-binding protein [Bifidobacteriaceae bacterium]|jgi:multiple sugar transport system substrate-binding protein|nr:extracellular solute-binding protein [Bifidobacteriaceae bacterium]
MTKYKSKLVRSILVAAVALSTAAGMGACSSDDNKASDGATTTDAATDTTGTDATTAQADNSGDSGGEAVELQMAWWGDSETNNKMISLLGTFSEKNPGITVIGQGADWDSYFSKLSTQVAGGTAPDVQQHYPSTIQEYFSRGALADLNSFSNLDLSGIDQNLLDSLTIDGSLVGVPMTIMTHAFMYLPDVLAEAGVDAPAASWTWDDFAQFCKDVTAGLGKTNVYGCADGSANDAALQVYLHGIGKDLVTADGQLAFDEADFVTWLQFWADLRDAGAITPPDVAGYDSSSTETDPMIQGVSASSWRYSGDLQGWQPAAPSEIQMVPYPGVVADKAGWLISGDLLSIYSGTKYPEEAAAVVNFFINDTAVPAVVTGRMPAKEVMQEALRAQGNADASKMIDLIGLVSDNAGPVPPLSPAGWSEVSNLLGVVAQEVAYGSSTPEAAAARFFAEAPAMLQG